MPPPRRMGIPAWMLAASPGHHFGGIHDPSQHIRLTGVMRSVYERTRTPPVVNADAVRRERGTWRGTIVRPAPETCPPTRPRLRHTRLPPRRLTLADRLTNWLERRLAWNDGLYP